MVRALGFRPKYSLHSLQALPPAHLDRPRYFFVVATQRPLSSSFWGLPYRILNIDHNKELLRGLWLREGLRAIDILPSKGNLLVPRAKRQKR